MTVARGRPAMSAASQGASSASDISPHLVEVPAALWVDKKRTSATGLADHRQVSARISVTAPATGSASARSYMPIWW
jgi:hypothetical protein